jgi:hypothetical protein
MVVVENPMVEAIKPLVVAMSTKMDQSVLGWVCCLESCALFKELTESLEV